MKSAKISQLLKLYGPHIKLDIGCGANPPEGFIGIDIQKFDNPRIIQHDIETYPWPLPSECVTLATASHVAEHINPAKFGFVNWMNEIWRVLKPDGQLMMSMPYGVSPGYIQDPTHCNPCNEFTWAYFDPLHDSGFWKFYKARPFRILSCAFEQAGFMEVALEKRREDATYAK